MTQGELASRAGIGRQAIILLEQNRGRVSTLTCVIPFVQFRIAELAVGDAPHVQVGNARRRLRMTQARLAELAGLSVPTIRAIEVGSGSVSSLSRVIAVLAPTARNKIHFKAHWQSKKDVRFTPPHIVEQIEAVYGKISIDPCGDQRSFVRADRTITEQENGLITRWHGQLAFVNPPFSELTTWIGRCADAWANGEVGIVIGLFPARTETAVFRDRIFGIADVLLLRGRLSFHDEEQNKMAAAPFAVMLCVWGSPRESTEKFAEIAGASVIWAARNAQR